MIDNREYGQLLKKCREKSGLTQQKLLEQLRDNTGREFADNQMSFWERATTSRPFPVGDRALIIALIRIFHASKGITTLAEANDLLLKRDIRELTKEEICSIEVNWLEPDAEQTSSEPLAPPMGSLSVVKGIVPSPTDLWQWLGKATGWIEAPEYATSSWKGRALFSFGYMVDHAPKAIFWWVFLSLAFYWLVKPMLAWEYRLDNYLRLSGAMAVTPFVVAFLTKADGEEQFAIEGDPQKRRILFFLKWVGAVVALNLYLPIVLLFSLLCYGIAWCRPITQIFLFLTPLFAHIGASQLPIRQFRATKRNPLRIHPSDKMWMPTVFFFYNILLPFFLFMIHGVLRAQFTETAIRPFLFSASGVVVLIFTPKMADWQRILASAFGMFALPFSIAFLGGAKHIPLPEVRNGYLPLMLFITCIILAQIVAFVTTLWLRSPTMFTWKGLLAFSALTLVLFFLPKWNPVALWAIIGSNLLWTVWGYKRYHTYFPIHPAFFWGMLLMIGCLGWGVNDPQHYWPNLIIFNLTLPLLDVWLYRAAPSGQPQLNDDAEANGE